MSANLHLVRSIFASWERGDYSSTEWADAEIEYVIADGPAPGTWKGVAGLTAGWRDMANAWEEWRGEPDEYRELDDERILALYHLTGRGKTSGLELGQIQTQGVVLFHLRGGKVTRLVHYWDQERALADLGLAPETDSR